MSGLTSAKALREKRARLANEADEILQAARAEERDLTAEEESKFDEIHADIEKLGRRARQIEKHEEVQRSLSDRVREPLTQDYNEPESRDEAPGEITEKQRWDAIRAWSLNDTDLMEEHRDVLRRMGVTRKEVGLRLFDNNELREHRAQGVGTPGAGGNVVPQGFRAVLEDALLQFGGMRQSRATVLRTDSGNQLEIPTANDTSNSGALLAENTQDGEQDIVFGQAVLDAYKYTSRIIRVSKELLQDSAFDLPSFLAAKLGERLGRIQNTHFTTGTGSAQPEGVVTGSTEAKEGAGGQLTTFIYDDFVDLFHAVDPAYRANAEWMMSDAGLKAAKLIKIPAYSGDTAGMPLWQAGLAVGAPDTILGRPYIINQDVADPAASAVSLLFGDFSKFYIRDVLDISLVRMDERYADFHQVAWVAISRNDSVLVDAGTNPIQHFVHAAT